MPPLIAIGVAAFIFREGLPESIEEGRTELITASIVGFVAMLFAVTIFARRARSGLSKLPDTVEEMRTSSRDAVRDTVPDTVRDSGGTSRGCSGGIGGIVSAVFLLAGLAFMIPFALMIRGFVDSQGWEETTCTVLSSTVQSHPGGDSTTYSIDIRYRYAWDGVEQTGDRYNFSFGSSSGYDGKAEVVRRYPVGAEVECWIDPDQPERAVLSRSVGWEMLFILLPLVFVVIGLVGVVGSFGLSRR